MQVPAWAINNCALTIVHPPLALIVTGKPDEAVGAKRGGVAPNSTLLIVGKVINCD